MIGHAVIGHAVEWCTGEVVCVCVGTLYNHNTSTRTTRDFYTYMINPNVFVFY